jgi:hypothetical protein
MKLRSTVTADALAPVLSGQQARRAAYWPYDVLILLIGLIASSYHVFSVVDVYDEGFANVAAMRLGYGDFPYRDFWTVYGPGNSVLLHTMHVLFGETLLVSRLVDVAILFSLFCILQSQLPRTGKPGFTRLCGDAALTLIIVAMSSNHSYAMWPALLLAAASLHMLRPAFGRSRTPGVRELLAASVSIVCASLFRHDVGAYLFVAALASIFLAQLLHRLSVMQAVRAAARLAFPVIALGTVAWGMVAYQTGLEALFNDLIRDPATVLQRYRHLPVTLHYPPTLVVLTWTCFPILTIVAASLVVRAARNAWRRGQFTTPLVTGLSQFACAGIFGSFLLLQLFSRADNVHTMPALLFLSFAVLAAAHAIERMGQRSARLHRGAAMLAVLALGIVAVPMIYEARYHGMRGPDWSCQQQAARAPCIGIAPDQARMLEAVQALRAPGEPIFVATSDNTRIAFNDVMFYFLAGKPVPVAWHEMHPGIATEAPAQRAMVADLGRKHVRHVVLVDLPPPTENNLSRYPGTGTQLDQYIAQAYVLKLRSGRYQLLEAREQTLASMQPVR